MKKLNQGFTLIELLVVIAIIGILSSVVLASLNTARDKGADAAAKANLNNVRAQAELVYDDASPNSYAAVCTDGNVAAAITSAEEATGNTADCVDIAGAYAMEIELKSGEFYCVDSLGNAGVNAATSALTDTNTDCD